jgi:hypothetical protein
MKMKTYKVYGQALNHTGSRVYPVNSQNGDMRWAAIGEFQQMKPVESVAFASRGAENKREFDRLFDLVTDGTDWGVRCELARGFPAPWPSIQLYADEASARKMFLSKLGTYAVNENWRRLPN